MRIGFFSDAHGNLSSTLDCLCRLKEMGVDTCFYLGDALGYLPDGLEVVDLLKREGIPCLLGNHEAMVLGVLPIPEARDRVYRLAGLRDRLSPADWGGLVGTWPVCRRFTVSGRDFILTHGRPLDPLQGYLYQGDLPDPSEIAGVDVVVTGHTHRPFVSRFGSTLWINPGSCGLPRDFGNAPSFAVYDCGTHEGQIHRFPLDVDAMMHALPNGSVHQSVLSCLHRKG